MPRVRIAMAQILVEGGQPENNLARAAAAIRDAASRGCHIVVLPECLNLGWTHPSARELAMPLAGEHSEALAQAARDAEIWVVAGLVERAGDEIFNSAVLLSPAGKMVLRQRKLNELTLAHDLYSLGTSVRVADTPLGRIGLLICADLFPDCLEYGRALGRMGCQLLLSPCAWAVPADHDNNSEPYGGLWRDAYGALTTEFPMTVVGVSNVGHLTAGPWAGRNVIGCSLAMEAGGKLLAEGPYGVDAEALIVCEAEVSPRQGAPVSPMAIE
ncbi:MAG: carbon-nitrogen hydrolase family protein [Bryobacterales bacterium]|nr:carbon-nitrogen hydrolase family protein [Bryobacterales bacterium]